jgi:esterase/lipase superfamily enzyme
LLICRERILLKSREMRREYIKWYSPSLHRDMELLAFGDRGFPAVVFPTSGGRFWEYEDRGMVRALAPKIERGELQVICLDSVDQESWYNNRIPPADRLHRQNAFDAYFTLEVAPFVRNRTSWPQMATTGCSFGGYHADPLRRNYFVLATGTGDPLFDQNVKLAHCLGVKQIPHKLDVWQGFGHDWPWWHQMAAKFFA